ncbi:SusC/RagA family TonB-linked outer membrane protein [Flavobacterium salilacus subsp. salilacus]|uniref:SusC/RagA family TonB-linked outer membrane protein n=1 Tax=Flavobacterium TaxID=237 RepID=UPI0010755E38|nr:MULTISPECIES: SusC/RagA family TonB-linked outer membrane protein [Flavobacterium]KAF2519544.1 SusC/RagA family TonB-linked outer membrane protein [Flavobacterium salilacus subsp. salilacus]MBE1614558.1 SusC/RagA family TonB-linked outer membrane protein [Flavobacterium sp. SaA2.13]
MRSKFTWIMTLLLAFSFGFSFAQERTVTGTVSDNVGPLPGASVLIKGTQRSAQTDIDGKYSINVNTGDVLIFSYAGSQSESVTVESSNVINVVLGAKELDVVIKDAYRSTTVRKNSSAVTTLTIEAIEDRANASVLQSLQGQIAGLNIATGSGQPGADSTIILRGVGTINGNVEPLFVVDGIPVDEDGFRSINQNDIATFRVLKDAAATSIYGNRGANGVIVITTKRGSFNQKTQFRYTSQFGYTELQPLNIELMDSRQFLNLQKQYGQGYGATLTDEEIDALSRQTNTYWTDVFFRKGVTKSHDLAITSGSENTNNFTSISYFEQEGVFINTSLKRFTVRNNFSGKTDNDKFTYGLNMNVNFSRSSGIDGAGSNAVFFAPFTAALRGLPYLNPYNPDGSITRDGGLTPGDPDAITVEKVPIVLLNSSQMNTDIEDEVKILAGFNANYQFMDNVTAGIQLGVDYSAFNTKEILHPESLLGPFQTDQRAEFGGTQSESATRDFRFNSLVSLNYNKTFTDHTIDFTLFTEYNKAHFEGINFTQFGLDPRLVGVGAAFIDGTVEEEFDNDPNNQLAQPYIPTVGSFKVQEGLFSYFANADYDYKGKYGITATVRRDASFRFIDDNKWGTFWSVGGRWNIDGEDFMQGATVNELKLRASYGTSGNQRINNAQYSALSLTRSLYTAGSGYNNTVSTVPAQFGNVDLRWEQTEQTNIGVDFGVWNNKLSGSVDVYRKLTTDLFQTTPVSPVNGTTSIDANIGAMQNEGLEITLKYVVYDDADWNISVNANTSYNKNEIRDLPESYDGIFNQGGSNALIEGEAIGTFYLVRYAGVNPSNGNPLFYTQDGGLTETLDPENDRVSTGKSIYPVWQGGFGSSIRYKGFEFNTQWSYFADVYRNNLDYAQLEETSSVNDDGNRTTSLTRAWQQPGDITDVPRVGSPIGAVTYINQSDRYLEDASFLRLRNILFGYSFSKEQLGELPISGLRLYVQGENLITFSSWRGWDAEGGFRTTDRGNYPTPKIYTFGAVINF